MATPNTLSSDILEQQYGLTTVDVLQQDDRTRIIRTRVIETGQILELSRVAFIQAGVEEFPDTHQIVVAGASMGKAFRAANVPFKRDEQFARRQDLPPSFGQRFGSSDPANVVGVRILVGPEATPYAEILETYHPGATWPKYYGEPTDSHLDMVKALDGFLTGHDQA